MSDLPGQFELSPEDRAAIDALLEAGLNLQAVPASTRPRAERAAALLGLIGAGGDLRDRSLVDVTFARVLHAGAPGVADDDALCPADEEALQSWIMHGFDAQRVPSSLRARARKHEALSTLAVGADADASADLVDRTLARVQGQVDARRRDMSIAAAREGRFSGMRLADLASVAAVLLIAGSIVWPVLAGIREQSRRALCRSNLGNTSLAMSSYAGQNRDSLPMLSASLDGGTWWNVGQDPRRSNSANLYTLAHNGFIALDRLACPGNPTARRQETSPDALDWRGIEEVSYSYQNMFGRERPTWGGARAVVLADRSPVIISILRGRPVHPLGDSGNHNRTGQHLLYNDGSAAWATSPILESGDNIWLPRPVERRIDEILRQHGAPPLSGKETPEDGSDTFLGP